QLAGDGMPLDDYLMANSRLPGPRGNLELIYALGALLAERARSEGGAIWDLLGRWAETPVKSAPANSPREFLPAAAAYAHGVTAAALPERWQAALTRLRQQACDQRWRTREMVAQGLQAMARANLDELWYYLFDLADVGDPLEMRAAAATVAEPDLLTTVEAARSALALHAEILAKVAEWPAGDRRSESFRALRQGLGYTLSVVVAAAPREGFAYLAATAQVPDADIRWILRENLGKARLVKRYPGEVAFVRERVGAEMG
ncbi:MAG: hypothetical protein ACYC7H_05370, partial [Chloroflexota bacterium]